MASPLKGRLEAYVRRKESPGEYVEGRNDAGEVSDQQSTSFEQTGFNIIRMIKSHLSHDTPLMFHIVAHYSEMRRGKINRFFFWVLAYIGQIIDMFFSVVYGTVMVIITLIVVIAIARGVGVGDFLLEAVTAVHG